MSRNEIKAREESIRQLALYLSEPDKIRDVNDMIQAGDMLVREISELEKGMMR